MSMFCFQCQETARGSGCTVQGVCGKKEDVAKLQDLLIYVVKGLALLMTANQEKKFERSEYDKFAIESLFATITNANFSKDIFIARVEQGLKLIKKLKEQTDSKIEDNAVNWQAQNTAELLAQAEKIGVLATVNEDIRSLRELLIYGIKGISAYAEHASVLGYQSDNIFDFIYKGLAATLEDSLPADDLFNLVVECGKIGVEVMALLDSANTKTYGNPQITEVNLGVGKNPGILVSGHDLKDLEELLEQTKDTGVDVYTHGEMLPANYYPAFKKYKNFIGNYGNAWWKQNEEFEKFNGPILMTTNCIIPPKDSYKDRIYTTSVVGFDGVKHLPERKKGQAKDFSVLIEHAKKCSPPTELEKGTLVGGFAHNQVIALADKIIEAVKSGAIKKFVVMAGCDGRMKSRDYYKDFALALPKDTVILTAGCAKYRYNKLPLGDINGIPRVLDAGQCNDSYSLAVIALKLKEVFGLADINELPIVYNIAWYEQKAVIVLLALLYLGVKNIHLGPTLPGFLSPNVAKIIIDKFKLFGIKSVEEDIQLLVG